MANHKTIFIIVLIISCSFALCACGSSTVAPHPSISLTPLEKKTFEPGSLTSPLTPYSSRTPTVVMTHEPTITPHPSNILTIMASLTPSATPIPEHFAELATQATSFPSACKNPIRYTLSPSKNWLVLWCGEFSQEDRSFEISNKAGTKWVLQYPNYDLEPVNWTNDEHYMYFTSYIGFDGGGTCFYGYEISGLYRLDLETGTVTVVLPWRPADEGYEVSFSPGGDMLAYNAGHPTIIDMHTGEVNEFYKGDDQVGDMTWSPDGSRLIYSTSRCSLSSSGRIEMKSSIEIYSLASKTRMSILQIEEGVLRIRPQAGSTLLKLASDRGSNKDVWYFDWTSESLVAPTP